MGEPNWGYTTDYPPRIKVEIKQNESSVTRTMNDSTFSKLFYDSNSFDVGSFKSPLYHYTEAGKKRYILRGLEDAESLNDDKSFHDVIVMIDHFWSDAEKSETDQHSKYECVVADMFFCGKYKKKVYYDEGYSDLETYRHRYNPDNEKESESYYGMDTVYYAMHILREEIPNSKRTWLHCDGYVDENLSQRIGQAVPNAYLSICMAQIVNGNLLAGCYGLYGKIQIESYYAGKHLEICVPYNKTIRFWARPETLKIEGSNDVYRFKRWEYVKTDDSRVYKYENPADFVIGSDFKGIVVAYYKT